MTRRQQQKRLEWEMTAESIRKRFTTGTKRALNWMALTSELHNGATGGFRPLLCHEMVIIGPHFARPAAVLYFNHPQDRHRRTSQRQIMN